MAIRLDRRPAIQLDPADLNGVRDWVCEQIQDETLRRGQPHPKIYLIGSGFVDTLDLDRAAKRDPGSHVGSTFQSVRRRPGVERCLLVLQMSGQGAAGDERRWALVFEERDCAAGRMWWMALLEYTTDPRTRLGVLVSWQRPPGESGDPRVIPAILAQIAAPPPGSRPTEVVEPVDPEEGWAEA